MVMRFIGFLAYLDRVSQEVALFRQGFFFARLKRSSRKFLDCLGVLFFFAFQVFQFSLRCRQVASRAVPKRASG